MDRSETDKNRNKYQVNY